MTPRLPSVGMSEHPLHGVRSDQMCVVPVDVPIIETLRGEPRGLLICTVNGEILSRLTDEQRDYLIAIREGGHDADDEFKRLCTEARNWREVRTRPGDIIVWHDRPMGREVIRTLLTIAIVVASIWYPVAVPYLVALSVAYNILVPPRTPNLPNGDKADDVFNASLGGNEARLDQPIWRTCGRMKISPPFAAQPYLEFRAHDPLNPDLNCDQYYYALFAIGIGNYDIERAFIGKTPISHYQDILIAKYLAPGELPTIAQANVVTSREVANADLDELAYVGGFAVCQPSRKVTHVGIDIAAPQGLGSGVDSVIGVEWQVDAREINDFGAPINEWFNLASESRTMSTSTLQRWSNKYALPVAMRCEVRVARTNLKNTSPSVRDGIQWIGLRGYLSTPAELNPHTAHFEVVMRASAQLNNQTQADFSMIVRAKVRTWNPTDGWGAESGSGGEIFTRNAAWWLADLWTNTVWGEGIPEEQIDLQGLYEWSLKLDKRQDHFDYCFSTGRDAWEAAQLIANSGRARAFRRHGVYTIARDERIDLPVTAFTPRNCVPQSTSMTTTMPQLDSPDGVIVEYLSLVDWDMRPIECPCPGFTVSDPDDSRYDPLLPSMERPLYITVDGVTGSKHAEREGLYQAYSLALRDTTVSTTVEMEAVIVAFMDPVRVQPQIRGYGQAGDVAFWDEVNLVMGLTEPPDFSGLEPLFLTLVRDDGSLTEPVQVAPGPLEHDIILPVAPDFSIVVDSGFRERPKYILGPETTGDELVKITSITDGGKSQNGTAQLYKIEALVDDERVHTADNHLLPGPGEIQDPIDDFGEEGAGAGGGIAAIPRLLAHTAGWPSTDARVMIVLDKFGSLRIDCYNGATLASTESFPSEWLLAPASPVDTANFEIMASQNFGGYPGATVGDALDVWLTPSVDLTWGFDIGLVVMANPFDPIIVIPTIFHIQIRRSGSSVVQAQADILLLVGPEQTGLSP